MSLDLSKADDPRVEIALKVFESCGAQERALKDEENRWVQAYWVVYAALVTLTYNVGAPGFGGQSLAPGPLALLVAISGVATVSTCLFIHWMGSLRTTYFGVRIRLLDVAKHLGLDDRRQWPGEPLQERVESLSDIAKALVEPSTQRATWERFSKPRGTFLQRQFTLVFGNVLVSLISGGAIWNVPTIGGWCAVVLFSMAVIVPVLFLWHTIRQDFRWFQAQACRRLDSLKPLEEDA